MLQGFQDVLPFSLLQGRDPGAWKAECKWFWQPLSGFQLRPLAEDDAALDNVLQLPDVAGPGVCQKGLHRLRGYLFNSLAQLLGKIQREPAGQQLDIAAALPQRRQLQRENVQPEIKIHPVLLFPDGFLQDRKSTRLNSSHTVI